MTSTSGSLTLSGSLADRDSWSTTGWCSIERTLAVVGTRSAMVLLREVFYGGRRFDDLARRAGITEAAAATRLKQLVEADVLSLAPYREPGRRTRHEYVLTEKGRELFPVLLALMQWGDAHRSDIPGGPIRMSHAGCGADVAVHIECAAGHAVAVEETIASAARTRP